MACQNNRAGFGPTMSGTILSSQVGFGYLNDYRLISLDFSRHLSRPPLPFWGPLAAILDFAGGAALQAVSERLAARLVFQFSLLWRCSQETQEYFDLTNYLYQVLLGIHLSKCGIVEFNGIPNECVILIKQIFYFQVTSAKCEDWLRAWRQKM